MKDDKTYPYLKIDLNEEFPRVYMTRRVTKDGARYFGPFATANTVRKSMDLVKRLFPYRSCTKKITGTDPRPCLEYYINRCVAPCTGDASREDYARVIDQVIMFMEGDTDAVTQDLEENMTLAAEKLEFERAAVLRDRIKAVERVAEERRIKVDSNPAAGSNHSWQAGMDVIGLAQGSAEAWVEVFFIRKGKLIGRDHFFMEGAQDDTPGRGVHRQLVETVADNARQGLAQHRIKWLDNQDVIQQAMSELEEELSLPLPLRRMECYDISHIQGSNSVGSMVVFEDGQPKRSQYRRFRFKVNKNVEGSETSEEHCDEPIILPRTSQALYLVQRIRDEAHRFAITYHRNLRSKSSLGSPIDLVSGIGPKRKRMLMRRFGSLKGIKEAALDEIAAVPGMTRSLAIRLKQTI
ncbi:UvrABC system protein C [Geodia barretti]|uniref:UvrABC system protein C n=1 Tax=Geodia barretti TaxID=519541 RepID=A0AA35WNF4_GEOBA|nr:UvrABC system protein C [Geodia barretti]